MDHALQLLLGGIVLVRRTWLYPLVLLLIFVVFAYANSVSASNPSQVSALRQMVVYVRDQQGALTPGALLVVRDRETYAMAAQGTTNAQGYAVLTLEPTRWYVVHVYYDDHATREIWAYTYIKAEDWGGVYPYAQKTIRRTDPWIAQVTGPNQTLLVGQPISFTVWAAHGLVQTNFDLQIRFRVWIDDDGVAPYLYEQPSPIQAIGQGFQPFSFAYQPERAGAYRVRVLLERRFEANDWFVADEGGWSWAARVGQPTYDLGGVVFQDRNRNGRWDADEPPLEGITLELLYTDNARVASMTTVADGRFLFRDLEQGAYRLALADVPRTLAYASAGYEVAVPGDAQPVEIALTTWTLFVPLTRAR